MDLHVYLDESGDLGFSSKSSSHFLLGRIITFRHFQIQRIPKKIRQNLHKSLKEMVELKASKCNSSVHKKILEEVVKCNDTILVFTKCQKKTISKEIQKDLNNEIKIYDVLLHQIVGIIPESYISQAHSVHIIIDDHWKNPKRKHDLDQLLHSSKQIQYKIYNKPLYIEHLNSISSNELQVVDFIINTCYRAFERQDTVNLKD